MGTSIKFDATFFQVLLHPQRCERRVRLHVQDVPASDPSPFDELLRELGKKHEERHLEQLRPVVDLSRGLLNSRVSRSHQELQRRSSILYQPLLQTSLELADVDVVLVGSPDFMIPTEHGWRIRDAKLARHDDNPGIHEQLNYYGLLLTTIAGRPPDSLEVYLGSGEIAAFAYVGDDVVRNQIEDLLRSLDQRDRYEPVGWSKCSSCGYRYRCWPAAEDREDVALLPDVDQGLAVELHSRGCRTITDLYDRFHDHEPELAGLRRAYGHSTRRVGASAQSVLNHARSFLEKRPIWLRSPVLPVGNHLAMFDLEGLPPQIDEVENVFLWGLKIFGDTPSRFVFSCAFPGKVDDRTAWFDFLELADGLMKQYGDIPFVHWAAYEKSKIDLYLHRYGDHQGVASRVQGLLVDLLPITKQSVCLPLPSYSLKLVEKYVGFQRQLAGKGDWAIAQYIRACETNDPQQAERLIGEILSYNEEDLDATWAVYRWLQDQGRTTAP